MRTYNFTLPILTIEKFFMKISNVNERNIRKFLIYTKFKPVSIDNDYQIFPKQRRFFGKIFLNIRNVFRFSPIF